MKRQAKIITAILSPVMLMLASLASAEIAGITGTACQGTASACFDLTARAGHIALGDGNSLLTWGYGDDAAGIEMQYPGPTLIVNQGDTVQVTLSNDLDEAVSIVFPGQSGVVATGGDTDGLMTREIAGAGSVVYTFTATEPGTYLYQSGSHSELQIQMGLVGALIVRPTDGSAYGAASTAYDREYLYFLTEMDRAAHEAVEQGLPVEPADYDATLWFINGRNGPDTMHPDNIGWLPLQPYGSLAQAEPAERVLMRVVGAGIDLHPFHHHGNNAWLIAQDGRVLEDSLLPAANYPDFDGDWLPTGTTLPNESISDYTLTVTPGSTYDLIFTWTGRNMNWDIYGNNAAHSGAACGDTDPATPGIEDLAAFNATLGTPFVDGAPFVEDPSSHCKDLEGPDGKIVLPEQQAMTFGGLWSGSPYMGTLDTLPPDQGGLNPNGGFSFMWHSHTEKELTNDDIFPGGMMTIMIIEAPGTL